MNEAQASRFLVDVPKVPRQKMAPASEQVLCVLARLIGGL